MVAPEILGPISYPTPSYEGDLATREEIVNSLGYEHYQVYEGGEEDEEKFEED